MHVFLVAIADRPPVVFADGTDDGEPQPVALHLFGRTVEAVEDLPPSSAGSSDVFDTVSFRPDTVR